ncbi:hypothetical protein [Demequina sp. NBRC 110054]|uniref:hypothetical protein n=1 Tax=Demequina sp. NBRC 110054 TaxID=1570343 RepID=UPI0009FD659E|nr:hypothetical protein [Demequina sp. NBRC 110054]
MTNSSRADIRASATSSPLQRRLDAALRSAPSAFVLLVTAIAVSAGLLVSVGHHRWWTVLPLAAVLTALLWRHLVVADPHPRARLAGMLLVGGLAAWVVVNLFFAAEYILVVRDPGFLTLSGLWLVDHASTDIPASGAVEAAALQSNLIPDASQAWNLLGDAVQPQGAKMLPATIAVGGWIAGTAGVYGANIVIGAAGMAAVYLVARRLLSPLAALAPAALLGLTVAHIGLSRAAYTEPLTLVLVFAGILWSWRGVNERAWAPLLAGAFVSGATVFARIDGAVFALGALVGTVLALSGAAAPRRWRRGAALAYVTLQAVVLAGGYLSLYRWSRAYLERLGDETTLLIGAYAVLAALAFLWAMSWVEGSRMDRLLHALTAGLGHRGSLAGGLVVVGLFTVLASRPLWMTSRRGTDTSAEQFTNSVIEGFQASAGLESDPTRTYAESSVTWLSYYLTWPLVLLAFVGFGVLTYRALRGRYDWWVPLIAILPSTLFYLWKPAIIADQIWSIRRFEPAALPGFAIAATVGGLWLAARLTREHSRQLGKRVVAAALVVLPITAWVSVSPGSSVPVGAAVNVFTTEMDGADAMIDAMCEEIDGRPVVLAGTSEVFGTIRVVCDVPVVLALVEPTQETLAEMVEIFDEAPVVVTRNEDYLEWTEEPTRVAISVVTHSGYSLQRIPVTYITRNYKWLIGVVNEDGTVTSVGSSAEEVSAG